MFGDASHCLNIDTFRDTAPLKSSQEIRQSAGGSSVGLHLLSPLSRDLFHQAIAEAV